MVRKRMILNDLSCSWARNEEKETQNEFLACDFSSLIFHYYFQMYIFFMD